MNKHLWKKDAAGWVKFDPKEPMTYPCQRVLIQVERPSGNVFVGKREGDLIVAFDMRWRPLPVKKIVRWREA